MDLNKEIIISIVFCFLLIAIIQLLKFSVKKFSIIRSIDLNRKKIIINLGYLVLFSLFGFSMAIIWGVNLNQFTVFLSSILAVLGVGFFAQWSILSNLTASVILFFSHPVRIGDRIRILDKDFDWSGKVIDITGFYFFMKTDKGEYITLPNTMVIQKGIEILSKKELDFDEQL
ncbi:mechanosensitive ion channel domain-containing protein [Flavicella sediminum]|uniref:mechanosensitive ion channel domain-containing protein n=1 Tax=Flavicella sediminum TaxID=2585141 RepID=UPI001120101B|nr:mechanosensitive ion channel family protein [Flavicella sediminum]